LREKLHARGCFMTEEVFPPMPIIIRVALSP
jgi:hypothetical protein